MLQDVYFDLVIAQVLDPSEYFVISGTWLCSPIYS